MQAVHSHTHAVGLGWVLPSAKLPCAVVDVLSVVVVQGHNKHTLMLCNLCDVVLRATHNMNRIFTVFYPCLMVVTWSHDRLPALRTSLPAQTHDAQACMHNESWCSNCLRYPHVHCLPCQRWHAHCLQPLCTLHAG